MGVPLYRWGFGVTVLLKKICSNTYVVVLRAICLFKASFNWRNKLVFARQMMFQAGDSNSTHNKLFEKRGNQTMDAVLSKTFLTDFSKVLYHLFALGGCDLGNCYNCGALPPNGLEIRAIGIPPRESEWCLWSFRKCNFVFGQDLESRKSYLEVQSLTQYLAMDKETGALLQHSPSWALSSSIRTSVWEMEQSLLPVMLYECFF